MTTDINGAGIKFPPPLYFIITIASAELLNAYLPMMLYNFVFKNMVIFGIAGFAIMLVLWAVLSLHLAKTSIEPWRPTTQLLKSGVFAFSRNPIYLAFVLLTAASGLWLANGWVFILLPLTITALVKWVINAEERYLAGKFGEGYIVYCGQVRRWL